MRKKLVAGNWKMHGSLAENAALLDAIKPALTGIEAAVCVPFPYLGQAQTVLAGSSIGWGAQNVSEQAKGAFTGEVSTSMLLDFGCKYVIVGHSERRSLYGESDELVASKYMAAQAAGLTPILCVGEGLDVRRAGRQVEHTLAQVDGALKDIPAEQAATLVIAYEPVWAIGTGEVATPEDAQEVCGAIRGRLAELYSPEVADAVRIQYGGSVKSGNVSAIMAQPDVDGALVGGASLDPEEFVKIVRYRDQAVG